MDSRITELATIRTTVPLKGADVFDDTLVFDLPAGSEGTVVYVFADEKAFEVEFLVWPEPDKKDAFHSVQIPVERDQCELLWAAPA